MARTLARGRKEIASVSRTHQAVAAASAKRFFRLRSHAVPALQQLAKHVDVTVEETALRSILACAAGLAGPDELDLAARALAAQRELYRGSSRKVRELFDELAGEALGWSLYDHYTGVTA